ncbi:MAG: polyisoprenoid-binding protein YceI [Myxococcota bacterium]|jgi:polyisoprenoid-binding protein YceI
MLATTCSLIAAVLLGSGAAVAAPYSIDDDHSMVVFKASHLGVAYTYGRFNTVSGTVDWDSGAPDALSLSVAVQTASVDTDQDKRDQHLRGPDFFDAEQFPEITFVSSSVADKGDGVYAVTGTLTLHGVSREVTVDLTQTGEGSDPWGGYRAGFHTTFSVDRTDYGMTYMADSIPGLIELTVSLEGIKK